MSSSSHTSPLHSENSRNDSAIPLAEKSNGKCIECLELTHGTGKSIWDDFVVSKLPNAGSKLGFVEPKCVDGLNVGKIDVEDVQRGN